MYQTTMSTRSGIVLLALLLAGLAALGVGSSTAWAAYRKPNIIVMLADDYGKDAASLYNPRTAESENAPTPSLAALAEQGVLFMNGWAMPACTPTRGTRTTGKLPSTSGVGFPLGLFTPRIAPPGSRFAGEEFPPSMIDPNDPDLIQRLAKEAGYRTYKLGKSHETETDPIFGQAQTPEEIEAVIAQGVEDVITSGFDKFFGQIPGGPATGYGGSDPGTWRPHSNLGFGPTTEFLPSALVSRAIEFIEDAEESGKPYYMAFDFASPHFPYEVAPGPKEPAPADNQGDWRTLDEIDHAGVIAEVKAAYGIPPDGDYPPAGTPVRPGPQAQAQRRAAFKSLVAYMDVQIGRLIEHVDLSDTYVFFAGDNGTQGLFFGLNAFDVIELPNDPTRSKGTLYRNGVEVPFLVAGPKIYKRGRTSEALITTTDIYATVLRLIRKRQPRETRQDSISFHHVLHYGAARSRFVNVAEFYATTGTVGGTGAPSPDEGRVVADERFRLLARPVVDVLDPANPFDNVFVCREDSVQVPEEDCLNPETGIYEKQRVFEFYDIESDPMETNNLLDDPTLMTIAQRFGFFRLCIQLNRISERAIYYQNGTICDFRELLN